MGKEKAKSVTLRDVAKKSGVSYQTVSRVINDHPRVSPQTRLRVINAIEELGYSPNRAAQSLASHRSRTLAVITFGIDYYGPAQMLIKMEQAARSTGYQLVFSNVDDLSAAELRHAANTISSWKVAGILLITPIESRAIDGLQDLFFDDIPMVQLDIEIGSKSPSVVIEQGYGSRLATRHLIDLGHTRICEISGPLNWFGAVARHQSWRKTMLEADLEPGLSIEGDWTAESGYQAVRELIDSGTDFTGLIAGNDSMALGAMRALHTYGYRIPEEISVVGYDDISEAAFFEPPLTTIRQEFEVLGQHGIEYLVERINNPTAPPEQHIIYPQLVIRSSTAART